MQGKIARRPGQDRLIVISSLWLVVGFSAYYIYLPGSDYSSYLTILPLRVIPISLQPMAGPFLTLAMTVSFLLASIWALRCSRDGAFMICAAWSLAAVARVIGTESGFWGRLDPLMPGLASIFDSLHEAFYGFVGGAFNGNDFAIAAVGSVLAYAVVLNSIPPGA